MFTGIIEALAEVDEVSVSQDGARIVVRHPLTSELAIGESLAVNGTCLTVVDQDGESVAFDVVNESLIRTSLGELSAGSRVNLERAMRADGRFDGHIVQGHVDGTVTVDAIEPDGDGVRMNFLAEPDLLRYVVEKGSVTLDGVSLTVADVTNDGFSVALIPHTLAVTNLGSLEPGTRLNLEVDVLAKYVERLMAGEK